MSERMRNSLPAVLLLAAACATPTGARNQTSATPPPLPQNTTGPTALAVVDGLALGLSCAEIEALIYDDSIERGATGIADRDASRIYPSTYLYPGGTRVDISAPEPLTLDQRGPDGADASITLRYGTVDATGKTTYDDALTQVLPCLSSGE